MSSLRLDWCSHEAAKYAVEHWHYSKRMPIPPLVRVGVWEEAKYVGCVLFGRGANYALGKPYGVPQTECCELVRVALTSHQQPVSKIISIALKFLRSHCPGLRLIISFADEGQGHLGKIYQAGNWVYVGQSQPSIEFLHEGRWKHNREVTSGAFGGKRKIADISSLPKRATSRKHKYLMPLDKEIRDRIEFLRKSYPKRVASGTIDTAVFQAAEGGETPTATLHSSS